MTADFFDALRRGTTAQILAWLAERPELASAVEPEGMPAIFIAVMRDDPIVVEALLRCGASASDGFSTAGDSPIQFARSRAVLTVLTEAGADPRRGRLLAALRGGREAVEFLLDRGVEPSAEVLREASIGLLPRLAASASAAALEQALEWACEDDRRDVVGVLVAHGAPLVSGTALARAAAWDRVELVRRLLELGADPDATLPDGSTPLIEAAFEGAEAAALVLLEAGARADRCNRFGQSALDGARESGAVELAARLRQR